MTRTIWVFAIGIVLISCSPVYVPNIRNAPMLRGAGEFQGSLHFGEGVGAQAAVAVTNHIGLTGSFEMTNRTNTDNTDNYLKHTFYEGGIGYYENANKICYEFYGGFGVGKGSSYEDEFSTPALVTGEYRKIFFQPSVGTNDNIFNWIVSARFSYVDLTKFTYEDGSAASSNTDPILFIEPSFTGRINFGKSKLYSQFQAGLSYTSGWETYFDYEPFQFTIGFGLRLGGPKISDQ